MPGTTPTYWLMSDDRLTATMLDVIENRNSKQAKANAKARRKQEGRQRGH